MTANIESPPYLLMTPGPLTTSPSVKAAMWYDSCTWDDDYKSVVTDIRQRLLRIANCEPSVYTAVLMQGSGTFGVESVVGSSVSRDKHKALILQNGVYGKRIIKMFDIMDLPYVSYDVADDEAYDADALRNLLERDAAITHIIMAHCETTTGILNDLDPVAELAKEYKKYFIVDAMSSFAGIEYDITQLGIDFLISSANKCVQGVPGFSFIICKKSTLEALCKDNAKSLSLDLYGQWLEMESNHGKFRYTSPTHTVLAFKQALIELDEEGGVPVRAARYRENQKILSDGLQKLGFEQYIKADLQSSIITTFLNPETIPGTKQPFEFKPFYDYLKQHGFVIYPGKIAAKPSFRIGTIGHVFPDDIRRLVSQVEGFIAEHQVSVQTA